MDDTHYQAWRRQWEQVDLDRIEAPDLAMLHHTLLQWQQDLAQAVEDVAWRRAEQYWAQLPPDDARTIRLLLKGAKLTPQLLQGHPQLYPLLLLVDILDPDVVRLWAEMEPETRAKRIEDLRAALKLTDKRRTTTQWEDDKESTFLAYDVLGLTGSATWDEVRKAYRDLAAKHHPDQGGDPGLFKAIRQAYKRLEGRYL
ncbi:MAG TPA: DnaJ domain-containing protein [Bacilli bacterium]|nr:DnaJ domain-containing protein [Bacilli bacterium]